MSTLRLYGSVTSPYVRRVRIVAHELGLQLDWTDTTTEAGQAELRGLSPLWKVPVLTTDGAPIFDSAVICRHLLASYGPGPNVEADPKDLTTSNVLSVIDGALDALINVFYFAREGVSETTPYLTKQKQRAAAAMLWLETRVESFAGPNFGQTEIALLTALDWMELRDAYPVKDHERLTRCLDRYATRPSVVSTRPA